jgi:ribosomal protein S18 acetylase RimI-like enzyme
LDIIYRTPRPEETEACAEFASQVYLISHADILHPDDLLRKSDLEKAKSLWTALTDGKPKKAKTYVSVAFEGARPVGYIISCKNILNRAPWEKGYLLALYVAAEHQRRGVGRNLLLSAMQHCERHISNHLGVQVLQDDTGSKTFYERFGAKVMSSGLAHGKYVRAPRVDFMAFNNLDKIMAERFDHRLPQEAFFSKFTRRFLQHL